MKQRGFKRHETSLLFAIMIVVIVTGLLDTRHNYFSDAWTSLVDITRQTSMLGIFSLGAAIVIISGGIDLSAGSVIAFSGTICATFLLLLAPDEMTGGQPLGTTVITLAILGTLVVGFMIGSLHAWLITVVGLPPFVATLATLVGLRSLGRAICQNVTESVLGGQSSQIQIFDQSFRYLATSVWIPALIFLGLAALCWLIMDRTVTGRHLYALGGNETATQLSGIQTDQLKWLAYCISAMLSSIAGILYIGDQAVADPQSLGRGYELNAIAAAVVGGCSLQGGVGSIPGTVLGALFLRTVIDGVAKVIKTGADVYEGLIVGVVVVLAVAFSQVDAARLKGKRFFSNRLGAVTILNLSVLAAALATLIGPTILNAILDLTGWATRGSVTLRDTRLEGSHLALFAGIGTFLLLLLERVSWSSKTKKLLLAVLVVGLLSGAFLLDRYLPRIRYQRATSAVVQAGGGLEKVADGTAAVLSGTNIDDKSFIQLTSHLQYLTDLVEIRLDGTSITDDAFSRIEHLSVLKRLNISETYVTKAGLRRLARKVSNVQVTADNLKEADP